MREYVREGMRERVCLSVMAAAESNRVSVGGYV